MRKCTKHRLSLALPGTSLTWTKSYMVDQALHSIHKGLFLYLSHRCTRHQDTPHTQSSRWAPPRWFLSWSLPGSLGCSWRKAPGRWRAQSQGLHLWGQSYSSFDTCEGEELGARTGGADSRPIPGRGRSRDPASWYLWKGVDEWTCKCACRKRSHTSMGF